jgi:hypothetical protein
VTPRLLRRLHAALTVLWLVPGSVVTLAWLQNSVAWVSWMSLYAIVVSHWACWQAVRAEDAAADSS